MRNCTVSDNRTTVLVASTTDAGPSGTALEVDGGSTISNTVIAHNSTWVTAVAGAANAAGTVFTFPQALEPMLIENSLISDNSVTAFATGGPATVNGAGLTNQGPLELRNTRIDHNIGAATGPAGAAEVEESGTVPSSRFRGAARRADTHEQHHLRELAQRNLWNHHPWRRALHELPRHARQQQNHRQRARSVLRMLKALHRH